MSKARGVANPGLADAMRQIRRSGACTPQADRRTKRARSRAASKARAIREDKP